MRRFVFAMFLALLSNLKNRLSLTILPCRSLSLQNVPIFVTFQNLVITLKL